MAFWVSFDDSPNDLRTKAPDGRDLVFLTGTAGFDFKGSGQNWLRDDAYHLVGPMWEQLHNVAATASLTSSFNQNQAVNYGLAVDNCRWTVYASRILLMCRVAVRDIDAHVYRFAYQVTAIGILGR
jgi:hypothetical protein